MAKINPLNESAAMARMRKEADGKFDAMNVTSVPKTVDRMNVVGHEPLVEIRKKPTPVDVWKKSLKSNQKRKPVEKRASVSDDAEGSREIIEKDLGETVDGDGPSTV